jgi:hypothetical protein
LTNRSKCDIISTVKGKPTNKYIREVNTMYTYLIEIATPQMSFWEVEKVRANSLEEAKTFLVERYGAEAFFGYAKALY